MGLGYGWKIISVFHYCTLHTMSKWGDTILFFRILIFTRYYLRSPTLIFQYGLWTSRFTIKCNIFISNYRLVHSLLVSLSVLNLNHPVLWKRGMTTIRLSTPRSQMRNDTTFISEFSSLEVTEV